MYFLYLTNIHYFFSCGPFNFYLRIWIVRIWIVCTQFEYCLNCKNYTSSSIYCFEKFFINKQIHVKVLLLLFLKLVYIFKIVKIECINVHTQLLFYYITIDLKKNMSFSSPQGINQRVFKASLRSYAIRSYASVIWWEKSLKIAFDNEIWTNR